MRSLISMLYCVLIVSLILSKDTRADLGRLVAEVTFSFNKHYVHMVLSGQGVAE